MEGSLNDSVSFTNSFVDETSIPSSNNFQGDAQDISIDSRMSDPLNVDSNHQNANDANDSITKFQKDSLVFAKLSGHSDPSWPARVAKVCWRNGRHCGYEVFFYGTYQMGMVSTDKVWAYDEESVTKFGTPKISSLRRRADFSKGLVEIRDCPEIAPSRDVSESASQIAKKLISRSTIKDDTKHEFPQRKETIEVSVATSTLSLERKNGKEEKPTVNQGTSGIMAGIIKVCDKSKASSWILSPASNNNPIQDESTDDEICPMRKKRKPSVNDDGAVSLVDNSNNNTTTRRSCRIKKVPYWKRFEVNSFEAAGSHIEQTTASRGESVSPLDNGARNRTKVETKKTEEEKKIIAEATAREEISPSPQNRRSAENGYSRARHLDADNSATGNWEGLQNSNPTVNGAGYSINRRRTQQADCSIIKEEPVSENPSEWSAAQTLVSIVRMDPSILPEDIRALRDHKVDGSALLKLNFHDFVTYCQVKVGPAIKLNSLVKRLKAKSLSMQAMSGFNASNMSYF